VSVKIERKRIERKGERYQNTVEADTAQVRENEQ